MVDRPVSDIGSKVFAGLFTSLQAGIRQPSSTLRVIQNQQFYHVTSSGVVGLWPLRVTAAGNPPPLNRHQDGPRHRPVDSHQQIGPLHSHGASNQLIRNDTTMVRRGHHRAGLIVTQPFPVGP
jgi:hypothetical protein